MAYVEYTAKERKEVLRKYQELGSAKAAERATGISDTTISRWAEEEGIKRDASEILSEIHGPDEEEVDRAVRLYTSDAIQASCYIVGDIMGRPASTIRRWLRERGVTRGQEEAQKVRADREGYKERVVRTCRYYAEKEDRSFQDVAGDLGICRDTAFDRWHSRHNPYKRCRDGGETLQAA